VPRRGMTEDPNRRSLLAFWQPRFWPQWLGLGLLRLVVCLPFPLQCRIGRMLGRIAGMVLRERREIARVNLALCFPGLDEGSRANLLDRYFESLGLQAIEFGLGWWASDRLIRSLMRIEGLEHYHAARADGRGIIFLSGHFSAIEFTGRILRLEGVTLAGLYRPNRNPLSDELLRRSRLRSCVDLIPKDNMRQVVRRLAQGVSIWYAPDQSYRRRYSVLIPFFGVPAMTNAALTEIARIGKARVMPFSAQRLPDDAGYVVRFEPAFDDFPTGDMEADARRVTSWLEERIREAPEQYFWIHRRFKGRPPEYDDPYRDTAGA